MKRLALLAVLLTGGAAPHSGYQDASPPIRAMQDDDAANPGFLWVQQGETLWQDASVASGRSCASCHATMRGAAARYPAFDAAAGHPVTLEQRINHCRTTRQGEAAWAVESDELLAISAFVGSNRGG